MFAGKFYIQQILHNNMVFGSVAPTTGVTWTLGDVGVTLQRPVHKNRTEPIPRYFRKYRTETEPKSSEHIVPALPQ